MRTFPTIESFVAFLRTRRAVIPHEQQRGMRVAGHMLVHEAQALIGTEDKSWPPLAEITVAEKEELGFTGQVSYTDPLLRRGTLRASIESHITEHEIVLGSYDPIAPEHEFGTRKIPARPFIGTTMHRCGHEAALCVYKHIIHALVGDPPPSSHDE